MKDADGNDTTQASYYTACNRNKRSVTIDMATPEGQQLIRQMAQQADVLVGELQGGGLARYGWTTPACAPSTRASSTARHRFRARTARMPSGPATT